jgi:hypothetical protein
MPVSSTPVVNSSIQHVTSEDLRNPDLKVRINNFNEKLHTRMDDTNFTLPGKDINFYYPHDVYDIPPQIALKTEMHQTGAHQTWMLIDWKPMMLTRMMR